jgi:hypothetical protein
LKTNWELITGFVGIQANIKPDVPVTQSTLSGLPTTNNANFTTPNPTLTLWELSSRPPKRKAIQNKVNELINAVTRIIA